MSTDKSVNMFVLDTGR